MSLQWVYWPDKLLLCFLRRFLPIIHFEICRTFTDVYSSYIINNRTFRPYFPKKKKSVYILKFRLWIAFKKTFNGIRIIELEGMSWVLLVLVRDTVKGLWFYEASPLVKCSILLSGGCKRWILKVTFIGSPEELALLNRTVSIPWFCLGSCKVASLFFCC